MLISTTEYLSKNRDEFKYTISSEIFYGPPHVRIIIKIACSLNRNSVDSFPWTEETVFVFYERSINIRPSYGAEA